jgi:hypothetical protein
MDNTNPNMMQILTEVSGAKREIYNYGRGLRPEAGMALIEGEFSLPAGVRKRDCFYIPATNSIREKTQAEKDNDKGKARLQRKRDKVMQKIAVLIDEAADFPALQAAVRAILNESDSTV